MAGEEDTLTRADARAYLRRFPAQGRWQVAFNMAQVLVGNAIVLYLVLAGRMRAAHLIVLVLAEAVLLIAIAQQSMRNVPPGDRFEQTRPWSERLPALVFGSIWVAGVYSLTLLFIDGWSDLLGLFDSADAWFAAGILAPLGYTVATALVQAGADRAQYRRHGAPFVSGLAGPVVARILTLVLGGIPFAMPFFACVFGAVKGTEFVLAKLRVRATQAIMAAIAMPLIAIGGFSLVGLLVANGVAGWAIGFVFAKLIAEVLAAAIPLMMKEIADEPQAA